MSPALLCVLVALAALVSVSHAQTVGDGDDDTNNDDGTTTPLSDNDDA
jgi:hypothetical protein